MQRDNGPGCKPWPFLLDAAQGRTVRDAGRGDGMKKPTGLVRDTRDSSRPCGSCYAWSDTRPKQTTCPCRPGNEIDRGAVARFPVARIMLSVLFVILARVKPPGGGDLVVGEKGYPSRPGWLEPSVPVVVGLWCGSARGKGPGLSGR